MNNTMVKIDKYNVRTDLYYDGENHLWIDITQKKAVIGMSPLIQETSGTFVAIKINETGTEIIKGKSFGSAEAEKHVGPLISPLSGKIISINQNVIEKPGLINTDPYGDGWMIEMEFTNLEQEMTDFISGEENIINWFKAELKKFDEKGWIAQ